MNPTCAELLKEAGYVASHEFICLRLQHMIENKHYKKDLTFHAAETLPRFMHTSKAALYVVTEFIRECVNLTL